MKRFIILGAIVTALVSLSSCAAVSKMAGVEMPKTEEVTMNVGQVCDKCKPATHSTIAPAEEIKYTKVGIADVDKFVESANKTYFTVLMTEKMIGVGQKLSDDPNTKVEGFNSRSEVIDLARGFVEVAQKDVPTLIESGQAMTTNMDQFISAEKAMVAPTATKEVATALDRLNIAAGKLESLATSVAE